MIQFQYIQFLYGLLALVPMVLLFAHVLNWKRKKAASIGDPQLVQSLTSDLSKVKFNGKFTLIALAVVAIVFALANIRIPNGNSKVTRNGIDVVLALDVSKSMLAQDVKPDRMSRAKQCMAKLIDELGEDRVGIVLFAGKAYLQTPLTIDHAAAKMYLSTANPEIVPTQGTVLADALNMSNAAFSEKNKKYKAIVLISDGEDHDESAVKTAKELAGSGAMICTIGIGSPQGANIVDPTTGETKKDATGMPVITRLNEAALRDVAQAGNGIYHYYNGADETVTAISNQLSTIGTKTITDQSLSSYQQFFPWLIGLAILALLVEFLLSEKKSTKRAAGDAVVKKSVVALGLVLLAQIGVAQPTNNQVIEQGNDAYTKGDFSKAAALYATVAVKQPANAVAQFNLGNAAYQSNDKSAALAAWDASIAAAKNNSPAQANAWYNKGVLLQQNKQLAECILAYKQALKLKPGDEDARLNLQKALQQKKQEEQQQNNQQNKNQPPKQDKPKEDNKPKPTPNKLTPKQAEEQLKALQQREKNLQEKLRRVNDAAPSRPEKDW